MEFKERIATATTEEIGPITCEAILSASGLKELAQVIVDLFDNITTSEARMLAWYGYRKPRAVEDALHQPGLDTVLSIEMGSERFYAEGNGMAGSWIENMRKAGLKEYGGDSSNTN